MNHTKLFIILFSILSIFGCEDDNHLYDGTLNIKGKISDDYTGEGIQNTELSIQGVSSSEGVFGLRLDLGKFKTNSEGYFSGEIKKMKNVERYDFILLADANYYSVIKEMSVSDVEGNLLNLDLTLSRLTELVINIEKTSPASIIDTLYISWGVINNQVYGPFQPLNFTGTQPDLGMRWIGGEVKSSIKTKTLANKTTEIITEIFRSGQYTLSYDTLYCERDVVNTYNINY
jgi:hypothetical protein